MLAKHHPQARGVTRHSQTQLPSPRSAERSFPPLSVELSSYNQLRNGTGDPYSGAACKSHTGDCLRALSEQSKVLQTGCLSEGKGPTLPDNQQSMGGISAFQLSPPPDTRLYIPQPPHVSPSGWFSLLLSCWEMLGGRGSCASHAKSQICDRRTEFGLCETNGTV